MAILELKSIANHFATIRFWKDLSARGRDRRDPGDFRPSETGRTVLLRLIAGVEQPSDGLLAIDGFDMSGIPPNERNIGMAFQNFALFPISRPMEYCQFREGAGDARLRSMIAFTRRQASQDRPRVSHAPRELSNGQKQRTALARALAASPSSFYR